MRPNSPAARSRVLHLFDHVGLTADADFLARSLALPGEPTCGNFPSVISSGENPLTESGGEVGDQTTGDTCALCVVMNSLRSERLAVTTVRGIRVCTEHLRELEWSGSRAATTLKKIADAAGS